MAKKDEEVQNANLSFYVSLLQVFTARRFQRNRAEHVVQMSQKYEGITLQPLTMELLEQWNHDYGERNDAGMEVAETITVHCFRDLALQMRNPGARLIFSRWKGASGTEKNLHVHARKGTALGNGFGEVQLVCDNPARLATLLQESDVIGCVGGLVHLSGIDMSQLKAAVRPSV